MDFKRKALRLTIGSIGAVALSMAAMTASATNLTGTRTYAAADGATATSEKKHQARFDRRKTHHQQQRRDKIDPQDYNRDIERTNTEKGDHTVGHTSTITNKETGNTMTREQTTSRDPETGEITRSNEVTGSGGKTWTAEGTMSKTDDGRTGERTVTGPDGETHTGTVDISKNGDQSVTRTITSDDHSRETTVQRTDDGYTRTTEFGTGATTEVDASRASDGTWDREVTRTPGDASSDPDGSTSDPDSSSAGISTED